MHRQLLDLRLGRRVRPKRRICSVSFHAYFLENSEHIIRKHKDLKW